MLIAIQVKFPNLLLAKTTRKSFTILSSRHNRFHKQTRNHERQIKRLHPTHIGFVSTLHNIF